MAHNEYSIRVYKQYFNFACAHFMTFVDGTREPLHGHNYRVSVEGKAPQLEADMVFDFLDIKPIIREICDELDHHILLAKDSPHLRFERQENQVNILCPDGDRFSFPQKDCHFLPISNTSAERLAIYFHNEIIKRVNNKFAFKFSQLKVEVEETPGQCAIYSGE